MTYCSKCGTKNEDDAEFCKKCGTTLKGPVKDKHKDDACEEECVVGKKSPIAPIFWGVVVILLGLWILFEVVLKETDIYKGLPAWLQDFQFWWLIGLIIAIAIIMTGIRIIVNREK
jgi:ribosomal protein L40E